MAECPICKSEIKVTPIGDKTVGIQCNCNGNNERYFINSGTVDDVVSEYIRKSSETIRPSKIPSTTIKNTSAIRTDPISKIEEHFPSTIIPRDIQKQILKDIETKIELGFKKIVISAPTGVGKSAIAVAIATYFEGGFFITKSKSLQDQYARDFPKLIPVKGKSNFDCKKIMEKHNVDDPNLAKELGHTCEKGVCLEKTITDDNGKTTKIFCKFKPSLRGMQEGMDMEMAEGDYVMNTDADVDADVDADEDGILADVKIDRNCTYYLQKYVGLMSNFSVWNYSGFFQLMINKVAFTEYLQKKVSIFDEAHGIEDQIINFIGIDISNKQLDECKIDLADIIFQTLKN